MSWTIGEVSRRTGVPPSTLRYWEHAGLLPPPERMNGRRQYNPDILDDVALIQLAQAAGLTIADTRTLMHPSDGTTTPAERWRAIAIPRVHAIDAQITLLTKARATLDALLDCTCTTFRDCPGNARSMLA